MLDLYLRERYLHWFSWNTSPIMSTVYGRTFEDGCILPLVPFFSIEGECWESSIPVGSDFVLSTYCNIHGICQEPFYTDNQMSIDQDREVCVCTLHWPRILGVVKWRETDTISKKWLYSKSDRTGRKICHSDDFRIRQFPNVIKCGQGEKSRTQLFGVAFSRTVVFFTLPVRTSYQTTNKTLVLFWERFQDLL